MNKAISLVSIGAAVAAAVGCQAQQDSSAKIRTSSDKVLVVYYSWSGNTEYAAGQIGKATGGKVVKITPETPYPSDYGKCVEQAKREIKDEIRPALTGDDTDISGYDVIFIGSPNWWSTIAPPVSTWLEKRDFKGKTVIPFITHGSGGMARCESAIRSTAKNASFAVGGAFLGSGIRNADVQISEWVGKTVEIIPSAK